MRVLWPILGWIVLLPGLSMAAQESSIPSGQLIADTARTNLPAAIRLCDEAVKANPTNAQPLLWRAQLLDRAHRYDEAIRDLTGALKFVPGNRIALQRRGEAHFKAGHFSESVADFDAVLERAPDQRAHHWQRGISLYYAKRFADGRAQFEQHQTVNPNDVENAVWHFLCAARESSVTNARAIMLQVGRDARVPMKEIDALYRGTGSVERVLAAAGNDVSARGDKTALFYAHLYLGLYFDVTGNKSEARRQIKKAATEFSSEHYMGDVARVHHRLLEASPSGN